MLTINESTIFPTSDFGNIPSDKYLVFAVVKGQRGPQQTGCFVLRPALEPEALKALKVYIAQLPEDSLKRSRLNKWIETNSGLHKETL